MKSILFVVGTRPEAIKLIPVIHELQSSNNLRPVVCLTGQHHSMVVPIFELFNVSADFALNSMHPGQSLNSLLARILENLQPVLIEVSPAAVVVQGDTTSTLAGALAAFHHQIPLAHVEAGLRTGNPLKPFPEEVNRILVTRLARWHFAPTALNRDNLVAEGVASNSIYVTGNSGIDALLSVHNLNMNASKPPCILPSQPFVVVTAHRRENFGTGLQAICQATKTLASEFPNYHFVFPVHLNPEVQSVVLPSLKNLENVQLVQPQPYDAFVWLLAHCRLVITDSGGIQEEAPSLGCPVIVTRDSTERSETLASSDTSGKPRVQLVGANAQKIIKAAREFLSDPPSRDFSNPYGDGHAAKRIVAVLEQAIVG